MEVYKDYGATDLEFLKEKPTEEVKKILGKYKGVGPKTIACVLMFQLQRDDFPVVSGMFFQS
jgi:endonuclease-3